MDRFYQDIPLSSRNYPNPGPRPRSTLMPHPAAHFENFSRFPLVGGNIPLSSPRPYSNHYDRYRNNLHRFQNPPPPLNIPRNNFNPFGFYGNHSRSNYQPIVNHFQARPLYENPLNNVNNVFPTDFWQIRNFESPQNDCNSKEAEPSEQDKQKEAEAIKKANLAAKLKKSLEVFKKNPSYKKKNLSIINKTDANRSSKYSSEIQPCFRWDLPLTVDDLKTIRRCPSRSESDDQPNHQDDARITEGMERPFDTEPTASSPDIIYVKRCRKRKLSESVECSQPKRRLFEHRRRHRSASPKLCLENSTATAGEQCQYPPSPSATQRVREEGSLPIETNESPSRKDKSVQSSNVMKLLGVKRREFDELVNHPRSPRVQFMLGLLMKRHKELLLQRAMRSRISNAPNPEESRDSDKEPSVDLEINTPDVVNEPIKLEGMGASDTIDQLSSILLESSLTVDIANFPQELIDQLSSILELGADSSTNHGGASESVNNESNFLTGGNDGRETLESSGIMADSVANSEEYRSDAEIPGMSGIHSGRNISQSKHNDRSPCTSRRERHSSIIIKRENAVKTSSNLHSRIRRTSGITRSECVQKSCEQQQNISDSENVSTGDTYCPENYASNFSHSFSTDVNDCDTLISETEDQIMMKIYSIDAKIFELTQEKNSLWQKLWKKKGPMCKNSKSDEPKATEVESSNISSIPDFENMPALKSPSSVNPSEYSLTPVSCAPSRTCEGSTVVNSRGEVSHSQPGSMRSTPSKSAHRDTSAVDSEVLCLPNSPNGNVASCSQQLEFKGNRTKTENCGSTSGDAGNELQKGKSCTSLDGTSKNSSGTEADSVPRQKPTSVDTDPDIVEIVDEPLEVIYDSNDPAPKKDINEGEFTGHEDSILKVKATGQYLFACCADHCVHCYDMESRKLIQTFKGHQGMVTCFFIDTFKGEMFLYTGSHDHSLRCFSVKEGKLLWSKKLSEPIQCMIFRWGFLFLGTKKGKIERYRPKTGQFVKGLSSMENEIMAIQASKEGPRQVLIVAPRNIPMVVRDANTGLLLRTIGEDLLQHTTYSLCESRGLLYAGTSTLGIKAFDFTSGEVLQTYTGCGSIVAVKVSYDRLFAASYDGKIYIYDLKCSSPIHIIDACDRLLLCMDKKSDKGALSIPDSSLHLVSSRTATRMDLRLVDLTLQEAMQILEDDSIDFDEIYIEPPVVTELSDEDSADEDSGGKVDNLSGRQLRANVEVVIRKGGEAAECVSQEISENVRECSEAGPSRKAPKRSQKREQEAIWDDEDIVVHERIFPNPDYSLFREASPITMFELFFDEELITHLVQESNKYAQFCNCDNPNITPEELKVFVAILFLSGYNMVPSKRHYWEATQDTRNEIVYNSMRRDRFLQINRFIHCCDNTAMDKLDKMWKMRPFMDMAKERFGRYFKEEQCLSFDESMISYFGRHGCKQFIRGKPIRFGYKAWCLNTSDSYLVNFDIYQGNNPRKVETYEKEFGKAAAPLIGMIDELHKKELPFRFYFDNYFTSYNLVKYLRERNYGATGTVRENRIPKDCPMKSNRELAKMKRGSFESRRCVQDNIIVAKWVDNAVVSAISSCHGINPISGVGRFSRADKKRILVPRPDVFRKYNSFMGGTDRMDWNISLYRIGVRGKKWWWPIFTWILDAMMHNAWMLMRKSGKSITQLEFRRAVVQSYLERYKDPPKSQGRAAVSRGSVTGMAVSDEIRYDGHNHLVKSTPQRRRCVNENCTSRIRTECLKCNVGLCIDCFAPFHVRQ